MDKDNLGIKHILTNLTAEKLESVRGDARQEVLAALCLMVVGLLLASVGLASMLLRLARLARCNLLNAGESVNSSIIHRKRTKKFILAK
jgi:hypothetical protein